jgi:uncharacterized protein
MESQECLRRRTLKKDRIMRIRVEEIPESGEFIDLDWGEDELSRFHVQEDPYRLHMKEPIHVYLEIHKNPDHIHVGGTIHGRMLLSCHRCLREVPQEIDEKVSFFLVAHRVGPAVEELELEEKDLDTEFFDGQVIDVDQLIAEQVLLALPLKVLCTASCRGLCPTCGANLNVEACRCPRETKQTPFSVLEKLKPHLP